jgi:hypothetical protein
VSDSLESGVPSSDDPVTTAWEKLQEDWGDPEAHKRFIALCLTRERLAEAGRLYREVRDQDDDAERRAEAERQIDRILTHALSTLEVMKSPPAPKRNTALLLVATVIFVLLVGTATLAVMGGP